MSSNQSVIKTQVQLISNDQQAINAAYQVADFALEDRNQNRVLPTEQIIQFSQKGLGGIRVPQQYGGAFVSNKTLAHVFRILSKADANVGQIPQNQFGLLNFINITGSYAQKQFIYSEILAGKRIANGGP
jgi:alkylation response protein AidB-like acyl-CoA dehydrogenase